mmetsp:Transcript_63081/g.131121  ORF Transcript_63081/g.131121 Transcript_63081/m.131121 type:complete len:150 (+) Transcript_63081:130-579(+)
MAFNAGKPEGSGPDLFDTIFCCEARKPTMASATPTPVAKDVKMGGVGIVFVKDEQDCLYVNFLVEGGPAHRSGKVQQGDMLRFINGQDIRWRQTSQISPLSGPAGSSVELGFERSAGEEPFYVALKRDQACYPDMLAVPPPGAVIPNQR